MLFGLSNLINIEPLQKKLVYTKIGQNHLPCSILQVDELKQFAFKKIALSVNDTVMVYMYCTNCIIASCQSDNHLRSISTLYRILWYIVLLFDYKCAHFVQALPFCMSSSKSIKLIAINLGLIAINLGHM